MSFLSLEAAAAFSAQGTDAFRVYASPYRWIDRFGDCFLISEKYEDPDLMDNLCTWCQEARITIRGAFRRILVDNPSPGAKPLPIFGDTESSGTICHERGLRFSVDFSGGYSCGFFPDQRHNRHRLVESSPLRVLNCFAYTCSFSVAAATARAKTCSIDLSKRALQIGKTNFALNNLSLEGNRFLHDDVFAVLPRLTRRGETFDAIILDPPTFSRGKGGRVFRVERDFFSLIELARPLAAKGALLLLSSNQHGLTEQRLVQFAHDTGLQPVLPSLAPLPDFQNSPSAVSVWCRA